MATTSRPITELKLGIRDTAGAVVASGKARFYQPGTLVQQTVYQDAACATPFTQPVTLNAGGQATVYTLEPVRAIVKDSTETTTYYDDVPNLNRHDAVYITHASYNSGAETTLETVLGTLATSLGADGQYQESATATARPYKNWLGETHVSVTDFGATGDGSTDDKAAIQAAINRVKARGSGIVYFPHPSSSYSCSGELTTDTAGVCFEGADESVTLKFTSTTGNGIVVNLGSAIDAKCHIKNLRIVTATTSSGAALTVTNGDKITLEGVRTAGFRSGIITSAVSDPRIVDCHVESTDGNAAAVGFNVGARGRLTDCTATGTSTAGTAFTLSGTEAVARGAYATGWATGFSVTGTDCRVDDGRATSCTTVATVSGNYSVVEIKATGATNGITLSGTNCMARDCYVSATGTCVSITGQYSRVRESTVTGGTTGVSLGASYTQARDCSISSTTGASVGAFDRCAVTGCEFVGCTTDLSVNTSATNFREDNRAATYSVGTGATAWGFPARMPLGSTTTSSGTPYEWQPGTMRAGQVYLLVCGNAGAVTGRVNDPTSTALLSPGDVVFFVFQKDDATNFTIDWATTGTIYRQASGANEPSNIQVTGPNIKMITLRWDGTNLRVLQNV